MVLVALFQAWCFALKSPPVKYKFWLGFMCDLINFCGCNFVFGRGGGSVDGRDDEGGEGFDFYCYCFDCGYGLWVIFGGDFVVNCRTLPRGGSPGLAVRFFLRM